MFLVLFQICNIMNAQADEMFKFQVFIHRKCVVLRKEDTVTQKGGTGFVFAV